MRLTCGLSHETVMDAANATKRFVNVRLSKRAEMLVNRKYDKATNLIIAAGLLAYASFQPKFRLRTALPREFIDESSSWPGEKRVSEEKVARAYWNCAVTQIQWKYGYGHRLPQDLPLEFAVQVWYLPSIWEKDDGWDVLSITNSLR